MNILRSTALIMPLRFGRCHFVIFEILCLGLGVGNCYGQKCHIVKDLGMAEYGLQGPGDAVNVTADSVIQCGSLCFQEKQCISFFFNTVTKTCKGISHQISTHTINTFLLVYKQWKGNAD